jgi:IclR family KDG regulon transcriptional repressor
MGAKVPLQDRKRTTRGTADSRRRPDGRPYSSAVAVERAVEVLRRLADRGECSLTELAHDLNIGASAVHRILTALRRQGIVEQDAASELYGLTWRVMELARPTPDPVDLRQFAREHMKELAAVTGETVPLHARTGFERVCIDQVPSAHEVRYVCEVGAASSLHVGASGRIMLAVLGDADLRRYLERAELQRFTPNTLTSPEALLEDVECTRARGYSHAEGDRIEGLTGVSAPLIDASGQVAGALSIAGPTFRCTPEMVGEWAPRLREAADRISRALGYDGPRFGAGEDRAARITPPRG